VKVLWLVSITIPAAADACGLQAKEIGGGWLSGALGGMTAAPDAPALTVASVGARAESRGDRVAGIRLAAHAERHVVQQEAHTVIAHREHDVRIAVRLGLIEEGLDPICRKIFSAAVQHGDLQIIAAGSERHRRQHAQQHADRQQQR